MIDLQTESLLAIAKVPAVLPGSPHISTIWRWVNRGCRGVKLETLLIGGKRFTSHEALQRFVNAGTSAAEGQQAPTQATADRMRPAANAELDEAGL